MRENGVQALLMGGQACILFGAAEFSRDTDFAVLASPENLDRLTEALAELQAGVIAVPPFEMHYLERGHAIHFRCAHPDATGMRVDVMARLRGVDPFSELWARRTTWDLPEGFQIDSLSLPDLVASKKTQQDKDWPMIRRLVEVSYDEGFASPTAEQIGFWLRELRTPEILIECVGRFPDDARRAASSRPALAPALSGEVERLRDELAEEERRERDLDRLYWEPLKSELEALRHRRVREP
jgi:hypothetical protein